MLRDVTVEATVEQLAPGAAAGFADDRSPTTTEVEHAIVAVVGLGYVGLPTAIALRSAGHPDRRRSTARRAAARRDPLR